jgi:hypothetical protein
MNLARSSSFIAWLREDSKSGQQWEVLRREESQVVGPSSGPGKAFAIFERGQV